MPSPDSPVHRYHDATKHHFARFARSLGYLDWASQPRPFRTWEGSRSVPLFPSPSAPQDGYQPAPISFTDLHRSPASDRSLPQRPAAPLTAAAIGDLLRHALGLSAWKEAGQARWSLRVNPSSGNLHPTEAYIVCGPVSGLCETPAVFHYAADTHALEERCRFQFAGWDSRVRPSHMPDSPDPPDLPGPPDLVLVALTSIHWRESWKYGERAFRYCQHDLGHAIAAIAYAAAMIGCHAELQPDWSHREIAALTGLDRDEDFFEAEREDAGALLEITAGSARSASGFSDQIASDRGALVAGARAGTWTGKASQLSEDHVQWTFIDEIAEATQHVGSGSSRSQHEQDSHTAPTEVGTHVRPSIDARALVLQRRSAVAFDPTAANLPLDAFFAMLAQVMPGPVPPFNALWWSPRIHLLLFVHRVRDLAPGLYLLARERESFERLRGAMTREAVLEAAHDQLPFWRVANGDVRAMARRLSCDQDIAADGFFSLGMLAEFDAALDTHGLSFYRQLFWESGVVGQALYLGGEAAGVRGTGIGCFYDDAVHAVLGLNGHAFQSLYHFTIGAPVEDRRLMTMPGYPWEMR